MRIYISYSISPVRLKWRFLNLFSVQKEGGKLLGFTGEAAYLEAAKVRLDS